MPDSINDTNLPTRLAAIVVALRSPTPDAALAPLLEGPRTGRTVTLDADELAELLTAAAAPAADSGFWSDLWLDLEADQAAHELCDNGAGLAQTARRAISEGQRLARERDLWHALCVRQRDALHRAYREAGRAAADASHAAEREARIVAFADAVLLQLHPSGSISHEGAIERLGGWRRLVSRAPPTRAENVDEARDGAPLSAARAEETAAAIRAFHAAEPQPLGACDPLFPPGLEAAREAAGLAPFPVRGTPRKVRGRAVGPGSIVWVPKSGPPEIAVRWQDGGGAWIDSQGPFESVWRWEAGVQGEEVWVVAEGLQDREIRAWLRTGWAPLPYEEIREWILGSRKPA